MPEGELDFQDEVLEMIEEGLDNGRPFGLPT